MSATVSPSHSIAVPTVATALLPIMAAVSLAFLVIGVALPVLPLHVHQKLGLSTFVVGLVTGTQFLAALMSRVWAGRFADRAGAKRAVVVRNAGGGRGRTALSPVAPLRRRTSGIRRHPSARPRVAWRGGKLHHHRRRQLGVGAGGTGQCRTGHRVDRHGDVCCSCARGSDGHLAVRPGRLHHDRASRRRSFHSQRSHSSHLWQRSRCSVAPVPHCSRLPARSGCQGSGQRSAASVWAR